MQPLQSPVFCNGQYVVPIEYTLQAPADEPGVKHQRVKETGRASGWLAAVEHTGIDKKSFSRVDYKRALPYGDQSFPCSYENSLQLLVPVPGDAVAAQVVVVAGQRKGGRAVAQLLTLDGDRKSV